MHFKNVYEVLEAINEQDRGAKKMNVRAITDLDIRKEQPDNEVIYWQLCFLSNVIHNWDKFPHDDNDTAGLGSLIDDIAHTIKNLPKDGITNERNS